MQEVTMTSKRNKVVINVDHRYLNLKELTAYVGICQKNAFYLGAESGARIKLGKRNLYDKNIIDEYLAQFRVKTVNE